VLHRGTLEFTKVGIKAIFGLAGLIELQATRSQSTRLVVGDQRLKDSGAKFKRVVAFE
jgi:hypothetical protein